MFGMHVTETRMTLGLYAHDDTVSVVAVSEHDEGSDYVWVTFGEVTANGFLPCYATIAVRTDEVKGVII